MCACNCVVVYEHLDILNLHQKSKNNVTNHKRNNLYLHFHMTGKRTYIVPTCINFMCTKFRGSNHVLEIYFLFLAATPSICVIENFRETDTICFIIPLLQELIFKEILILARDKTGLV